MPPPRRRPGSRSTPEGEHVPVMLPEVLTAFAPLEGKTVVDCTLGFGGHALELLKAVGPAGRLIGFDLDSTHLCDVQAKLSRLGNNFSLRHGNFAGIANCLGELGIERIDCLLADLGVSSMQIDDPARGFSYMRCGPLDMRMDRSRGRSAAEILATATVEELRYALREFGDEPAAERIAEAIVSRRRRSPLRTTLDLRSLIETAAPVRILPPAPGIPSPRRQRHAPLMRVFQALRILVNRETANLHELLRCVPDLLAPGGVAAIISFHSGEDRLVKSAFRTGARAGVYQAVSDEPLRASPEEMNRNPRSRSAKLRTAIRAPLEPRTDRPASR